MTKPESRIKLTLIVAALILAIAISVSEAALLTVKDKRGEIVKIEAPVRRAIVHINYELIPALGIWDRVIGMGGTAFTNDLIKATKPAARIIPVVGEINRINAEQVASLKADLLITWNYNSEELRFIEQKGRTKIIAFNPESLREFYEMLQIMGDLFGKRAEVANTIGHMETIFNLIRQKTLSAGNVRKKNVLWLGSKPTIVIGRNEPKNDIVRMAGAVNPAVVINKNSAEVSLEQITLWNPDVIFITGHAAYSAKDVLSNPQWKHIKAVREGRVFKAPEWSTWSPRLAPIALWMAARIYPQRYRNLNLENTFDQFFRSVFHIPYAKVTRTGI